MIIAGSHLVLGMEWWLRRGGTWAEDFLNAEYERIYAVRASGITARWWDATVGRLSQWKAYRGPNPPNKRDDIHDLGTASLEQLSDAYKKIMESHPQREPTITELDWSELETLWTHVMRIKRSVVFAGKLCHFMFPKLFLVLDNEGTGTFDEYECVWRGMKDAWIRCPNKEELIDQLRSKLPGDRRVQANYPWETKIMELCLIGCKHPCP